MVSLLLKKNDFIFVQYSRRILICFSYKTQNLILKILYYLAWKVEQSFNINISEKYCIYTLEKYTSCYVSKEEHFNMKIFNICIDVSEETQSTYINTFKNCISLIFLKK